MIKVKTPAQIVLMRKACEIVKESLLLAGKIIKAGMKTKDLDREIENFIISQGAKPTFKGYNGYPFSTCISVNEAVVHGFPSDYILKETDIVSIDVGANYKGFNGDAARTFMLGKVSPDARKLVAAAEECFFKGIKNLKAGMRVSDISKAVQEHAESNGFSVVRELTGHGIGEKLHEDPQIPNFVSKNNNDIIPSNCTLAIEPMINYGRKEVYLCADGWTVKTSDNKLSAHYENTVLVTEEGVEILTL